MALGSQGAGSAWGAQTCDKLETGMEALGSQGPGSAWGAPVRRQRGGDQALGVLK